MQSMRRRSPQLPTPILMYRRFSRQPIGVNNSCEKFVLLTRLVVLATDIISTGSVQRSETTIVLPIPSSQVETTTLP